MTGQIIKKTYYNFFLKNLNIIILFNNFQNDPLLLLG